VTFPNATSLETRALQQRESLEKRAHPVIERRLPDANQTPIYQQMRDTLATEEGRALYRRRTQIIEPVFAHIKVLRRADRFQRRGLPACRSEWRLIAATHNLLKLWRLTRTPLLA
jgi:hypothetical protein